MAADASFDASLTVVNDLAEVARAAAWLAAAAGQRAVAEPCISRLQFGLDEILSNVIMHGLAGVPPGTRGIALALRVYVGRVELEIIDDGAPFDPAAYQERPRAQRVAERRPGGVGLMFTRAVIDEIRFTRRDGRNHVMLTQRLPPDSGRDAR